VGLAGTGETINRSGCT